MNEEQIRQIIRQELSSLIKGDKYTFEKLVQFNDGRNIQLGITTGTKIGTATNQKIGFYNTTPIVQRSGADQVAVSGSADGTYSGNEQTLINDIKTLVNELRAAMVALGLIKGSS